eukprot:jgi/Galph1/55/GphlegSOOS_G4777.1
MLPSFRFPAEWETHEQSWIGWPERHDNWRNKAIPAQQCFENVIRNIAIFEQVSVLTSSKAWSKVQSLFSSVPNIRVIELSTDDCWLRDTGPLFIINCDKTDSSWEVRGVDFAFNAWGGTFEGCYSSWEADTLVAWKILGLERLRRYTSDLVLEGGAISCDGQGTAITTDECLLNPNRNPSWNRQQIEEELHTLLGIKKVIWLPFGVYGDIDTNGHVDNLCVFIGPAKVVLHWTEDLNDPQYERSVAALSVLEAALDAKGRRLTIYKLPAPGPFYRTMEETQGIVPNNTTTMPRRENDRLVASYVNFYFVNNAIIMPSFGEPWDTVAEQTFHSILPEREIKKVAAKEIVLGGGGIHCITQQQPITKQILQR